MKKGQNYIGKVDCVNFPNKGVIWIEEENAKEKVVVKGVLPGQTVCFQAVKTGKNKREGRLVEIIQPSEREGRIPPCPHFGICGGCNYQTMPYSEQLRLKEEQVCRLLSDVLKEGYLWEGIIGSPEELNYRNKMEFSFGDEVKDGPLALGMHKKGSFYDIVTTAQCQIVDNDFNIVLEATLGLAKRYQLPFYHKMSHQGYLRHLLIRRATKTGEMLISLVTTSEYPADCISEKSFLETWTKEMLQLQSDKKIKGNIKGILHLVNNGMADVVASEQTEQLFGEDYFYENLLGLEFKISTFSFFQTNSLGAEVLYEKVREYVGETRDRVVYDLYSGTGTIAQLLAPVAKKVIGVEIVEEAVLAARENARRNGLSNCEFIAGDVLRALDELEEKPDYIILDPPRDGIHPKALQKIILYGVEKMVYISCKPTSLARDLIPLQEAGYRAEKICMIDMFPQTANVETVCLLSNRKSDTKVRITVNPED